MICANDIDGWRIKAIEMPSILFEGVKGMNEETSLKIASIALLVHGLMEILGALILPFTPSEFLPTGFVEKDVFGLL